MKFSSQNAWLVDEEVTMVRHCFITKLVKRSES